MESSQEKMASSIALTGATGFVGMRLQARLAREGFHVLEIGRQPTASDTNFLHINKLGPDTSYGDKLVGYAAVVHLAARVHVMQDHAESPLKAFQEVNLYGTENLARQAAAAGVRRFIYVSSIKVNGEHTEGKAFTEDDIPAPQDSYGVSKWQAEQMLQEIGHETGMEIVILRPPLVYGPGVKANFYSLIKLVGKGLPLPLAAIRNRRSMIYVDNLVDALIVCVTHPAAAGQTYLVSDGESVSTPQLVKDIATAIGRPSRLFPCPFFLMRACATLIGRGSVVDRLMESLEIDDNKIRQELTWRPPYSRSEGMLMTADWFQQHEAMKKVSE